MMDVLVTGATAFIGPVVQASIEASHQVLGLAHYKEEKCRYMEQAQPQKTSYRA
jgi:nucleoside-diphosphate-sugar epimerase